MREVLQKKVGLLAKVEVDEVIVASHKFLEGLFNRVISAVDESLAGNFLPESSVDPEHDLLQVGH